MEKKAIIVLVVGLLIFGAHAFVELFKKTKIPDVLLLIFIGLFLGPIINIVSPKDFGEVGPIFSSIALIIILFEGGLELNIDSLKKSIRSSALLTIVSFFLTLIIISFIFSFVFGYSILLSLFIGAILASPAPAIIIPLSKQLNNISSETRTKLTLESALGEALSIVFALSILQFMLSNNPEYGKITGGIIASFFFAIVIGFVTGYLWSIILNKVREIKDSIFLTPSFVFVIYGISEILGFSGPVAVLTFGITIGNADMFPFLNIFKGIELKPISHNETEKLFFSEMVFLVKTFFFVYLGISIIFSDIWILIIAGILCIAIVASRFIATKISTPKIENFSDIEFTYSMFGKGLATTVLASLPYQNGIAGGEYIQNTVYFVILISILLVGLFIFLSEKQLLKFFTKLFYSESKINSLES
jgi:NhaP-type Na+/H+ or K+/H+ antiporter